MSDRTKFLNKKAALAAAMSMALSAGAEAAVNSAEPSGTASTEIASVFAQIAPPSNIILEPAASTPMMKVADHYSHSSHSSHASHASHSSHYSSRY